MEFLLLLLLIYIPHLLAIEFCHSEYFVANCTAPNLIIMLSAKYGRMHSGRCVTTNLDCHSDVITYFDQTCSLHPTCRVYISEPDLHRMGTCSKEFSSYLDAEYACIKVNVPTPSICSMFTVIKVNEISEKTGYLTGVSSGPPGTGTSEDLGSNCPWLLKGALGQKFRLILINLGSTEEREQTRSSRLHKFGDNCRHVADIKEHTTALGPPSKRTEISVCLGTARESVAYTSVGPEIFVHFYNTPSKVLLKYEVIGCAKPSIPLNSWLQMDDISATIRCNSTKETMFLTCVDGRWVGQMINCSDKLNLQGLKFVSEISSWSPDNFPYGILLVVAIGVALGVLIGGILLSFVAFYMKRLQNRDTSFPDQCETVKQRMLLEPTYHQGRTPYHHPPDPYPDASSKPPFLYGPKRLDLTSPRPGLYTDLEGVGFSGVGGGVCDCGAGREVGCVLHDCCDGGG